MALFFIAIIGLGLFYFFLSALARVNSVFLLAVLQWTSLSLLFVAFGLFILSGRIAFATLLLVAVLLMGWHHKRRKKHKPLALLSLSSHEKKNASDFPNDP